MNGFIFLYRILFEKPIWKQATNKQRVILITLLSMANFKESEWVYVGKKFKCLPGQFITSLDRIKEACDSSDTKKNKITIQNIRTALSRFEQLGFLTNESTSAGRLITIVNWALYQGNESISNKASNKDLTKQQQSTNKDLTPKEECKNERMKENNKYTCAFEDFWKSYPRKDEKGNAYKKFNARLKDGYAEETLLKAAVNYADFCKKTNRDKQYIKQAKTFLADSAPFLDYVTEEGEKHNEPTNRIGYSDQQIAMQYTTEQLERIREVQF